MILNAEDFEREASHHVGDNPYFLLKWDIGRRNSAIGPTRSTPIPGASAGKFEDRLTSSGVERGPELSRRKTLVSWSLLTNASQESDIMIMISDSELSVRRADKGIFEKNLESYILLGSIRPEGETRKRRTASLSEVSKRHPSDFKGILWNDKVR